MVMVKDALRGYLALASGVTEVTAARARAASRILVEQGESTAAQVTALAEDLVATSRRNREGLVLIVRHEIEATLRRLGLGPAGDVDALNQRVRRLEQALREISRESSFDRRNGAASTGSAAKKTAAKKTAAKKTTAKKTTAKKITAKKITAKKAATPKKTATKKTAPKAAAKSTANKSTAKRTPGSTAKKAAPKRSATPRSARRSSGPRS
jgi:polyhydroxyalkanoate synthesis regulator phasin